MDENVQVLVRFRAPAKGDKKDSSILAIQEKTGKVIAGAHTFIFDHVFGEKTEQEYIYEKVVKNAVISVCNGYNATIFAYGASGSGKSYTMFGSSESKGIIPRACGTIFDYISQEREKYVEMTVKCSFIEIYREHIKDLLNKTSDDLKIRQCNDDVYIQGLTEKLVYTPENILQTIQDGTLQRTVASTSVNNVSSRSHAVLTLTLIQVVEDGSKIISKLNMIDLAGSENVGRSEVQGVSLSEAQTINKSLSALGNVINALTEKGREHIPYRDSKLTYLLQDSLGGNSKTIMIATASPDIGIISETINTLKFAKRAKDIKNIPKINKNESQENLLKTIEKLQHKIELLEEKLVDSEAKQRVNSVTVQNVAVVELFRIRTEKWESRVISLEKLIEMERQKNKRLNELFEKTRTLWREDVEKFIGFNHPDIPR